MAFSERKKGFSLKMNNGSSWLSLIAVFLTFIAQAWASEPRVVCYYTNWSVYRPGTAKFNPQNINPYLCTHLIYAFGGFTKDNTLKPFDKYQDIEKGGYAKFTGLKTYNKNLKTMLAIGGWNEGSTRFSPMVAAKSRRKEFVRNAIKFLRQNHFDGLDLDWEYPAFRDGGKPKDRENYAKLVKELREEFERESGKTGKPRLLLTMAVPAGIEYIQKGFDVKTLNRYLDWMNLLTYDYHSAFEPAVNHHAPLYPLEEPNEYSVDNELNIDYTIKFYIESGADPEKLVLGIPTYGRSYTLFNADATDIGSPADGPGEQGEATREKGYLAYYEICEALKPKVKKTKPVDPDSDEDDEDDDEEEEENEPWTVVYPNADAMGPVAYKGNQWVGYDDIAIVQKKAEYVAANGLGGIMFWSIDNDDFRGNCHQKPYPLIEAAKEAYIGKLGSTDNVVLSERSRVTTSSSNRRRNRPTTSSTQKPASRLQSNNRKNKPSESSTPSWSANTPEPPTTPDPGSDFKCVDEGFFQHPRDCKKYFWCLDSGPSNLGIVAHQFTCPSGLFFNKAADSCDFARNVLCKKPGVTTSAPTTSRPTTQSPTTEATTKRAVRLSTRNSLLFRTTSTTQATVEEEDEEEVVDELESIVDNSDVDAEDPKVIKELIDLIKKVGGVEQLEKQLHLAESSMSSENAGVTTPTNFNKNLYKVLERTRKNNPGSELKLGGQNSRRGPQNAGLESVAQATSVRKDRPQYTTINRARPSTSSTTEDPIEDREEDDEEEEYEEETPASNLRTGQEGGRVATTARPLQYVNIRRARPSTISPSDTGDDSASRNALFERQESSVSDSPSVSQNALSAKRESGPEYVTIKRQRPTTEAATTQYENTQEEKGEVEKETASSPSSASQPQYTSIVRSRSTTSNPLPEEPINSPNPTTILDVQISSILNSPISTQPDAETTEPETTQTTIVSEPPSTSTSTSTTTAAPISSTSFRRSAFKRRGTTTTTTAPASTSSSTTQVSSERNYAFVRRRRPLSRPNEISPDLDESLVNTVGRKIRSTTPDSREGLDSKKINVETNQTSRRYRQRYQQISNNADSVPAAASTASRGRIRSTFNRDDLSSLTPITSNDPEVGSNENDIHVEPQFRPRTTAKQIEDSDVSAATVELIRPNVIVRGRSRFTVTSTTDTSLNINNDPNKRTAAFTRFSPRPFRKVTPLESSSTDRIQLDEDDSNDPIITTPRSPLRLPFSRGRLSLSTTTRNDIQGRKLPFPLQRFSTPSIDDDAHNSNDDVEEKNEDIKLSESSIEEREHEHIEEGGPKRVVIKRIRPVQASNTEDESQISTEEPNKHKKVRIIRRRPTSATVPSLEDATSPASAEISSSTVGPRRIKIIRKKPLNRTEVVDKLQTAVKETPLETIINYGEKSNPSTTVTFTVPTTASSTLDISDVTLPSNDEESENKEQHENTTETITTLEPEVAEHKPSVVLESDQKIDISADENTEANVTELQSKVETTTVTTSAVPSSTSRSRSPYRPPKRLLTISTEPSILPSIRTYSRKYISRSYSTSAADERVTESPRVTLGRRPLFTSKPFTRKPFTTAKTTPKIEEYDEYESEERLEEEPDINFKVLPENQFFTRKPVKEVNLENDGTDTEDTEQEVNQQSSRKPFTRPKSVNSNTFRTTKPTTELPQRQLSVLQNRNNLFNKSNLQLNKTDTKKRVQNIPIGYNASILEPTSEVNTSTNIENDADFLTNDGQVSTTIVPGDSDVTTTEDDDYMSFTTYDDVTKATDYTMTANTDSDDLSTTPTDSVTDDYLEFSDDTTYNPTIHYSDDENDETTTVEDNKTSIETTTSTEELIVETTTNVPVISPIVKTQFDKLFSVSRVVEVSSQLNKHRVNKNNQTISIETGSIMQEKKPTESKIGEVSRFSLIKIVEDEIPIYLTKLGHVYPVANPPDNPIRIDEGRNARDLLNFSDSGKENLVASESINEAYRHINKVPVKSTTTNKAKPAVERLSSDDFLTFVNDEKKNEKDSESNPTYWQFVPAAYENEKSRQNKAARSFEIITPRNLLTNPSTLPLEGLFKTENPIMQTPKNLVFNANGDSPFVVYSSSVTNNSETLNQLRGNKTDDAIGIKTFAKGQEFNGTSMVEKIENQYPVYTRISTDLKEHPSPMPVVENSTSPPETTEIVETLSTTLINSDIETTTLPSTLITTTEIIIDEITTQKLSLLEALNDNAKKRPKFAFPRRPNFKPSNATRPSLTISSSPRTIKKLNKTSSATANFKLNKTTGFNPSKSRFTANRSQNVPIDLRVPTKPNISRFNNNTAEYSKPSRNYTTSPTERKINIKPFRPNVRPAFIPRRTTSSPTTQATKRPRPNFLRRTKATAPPTDTTEQPDNDLTTEFSTIVENTTHKYTRRGQANFKQRLSKSETDAKAQSGVPPVQRRRQSAAATAQKSDARKPARTLVRRRHGGANATTSTTQAAKTTTRRPFRVASRRRLVPTSSTTATPEITTVVGSEESLQDIEDRDSIEEPDTKKRRLPLKKTVKLQRRPLTSLKEQTAKPEGTNKDQNPAATSEDQTKRQSKKYSASFKQNQLEEVIKQKSREVFDGPTKISLTSEDISAETAVAIAAHQLLGAPLPTTTDMDYQHRTTTTKKQLTRNPTTQQLAYTDDNTYPTSQSSVGDLKANKIIYHSSPLPSGYTSAPSYATTSRSPIPSLIPRQSPSGPSSGILSHSAGYSGISLPHLGPSTVRYLGTSDKYLSIPIEEFGYPTDSYVGGLTQEPVYFTREYLLESPVTRTYDDEYQYLSPVTTPHTTTQKTVKKNVFKRISTTQRPTTLAAILSPATTTKPRRTPQRKPFEKVSKVAPKRTYKPIENYDYYDDSNEKIVNKYTGDTKVVVHGKGTIECFDIGNFPHPTFCKKFISCARMERGNIVGWEYICPEGLSFDPVGGMCNWSAGLGCEES